MPVRESAARSAWCCQCCYSTSATLTFDITFTNSDGQTERWWVEEGALNAASAGEGGAYWRLAADGIVRRKYYSGGTHDAALAWYKGFWVRQLCNQDYQWDSGMMMPVPVGDPYVTFLIGMMYDYIPEAQGHTYTIAHAGMECRGGHVSFHDDNLNVQVDATITIKHNTCCKDDDGNCQNRGQGQTHCDGGCVEEPPLP